MTDDADRARKLYHDVIGMLPDRAELRLASAIREAEQHGMMRADGAAVRGALEGLLERWDTFTDEKLRGGWGNQHDAYYDLAKHAQRQWKAARQALADHLAALDGGAKCHDCPRPYGDPGFADLSVPNEVWRRISPTGDDGGLLCPSCLIARLVAKGIECDGMFSSGPIQLASYHPFSAIREAEQRGMLRAAEIAYRASKPYDGEIVAGNIKAAIVNAATASEGADE